MTNKLKFYSIRILLILYCAASGLFLQSFIDVYEVKQSTAEVQQEEGLYIYYRSKPVKEYQYLGTYKIKLVLDDTPALLFSKLVRKTKEKYPSAQGVIIDNDMGKADAIIFK